MVGVLVAILCEPLLHFSGYVLEYVVSRSLGSRRGGPEREYVAGRDLVAGKTFIKKKSTNFN